MQVDESRLGILLEQGNPLLNISHHTRLNMQVDETMLAQAAEPLGGCSDVRVVWDMVTGK